MRWEVDQPHTRARDDPLILFDEPAQVSAVCQPWPHPDDEVLEHGFHLLNGRLIGVGKHLAALLGDQLRVGNRGRSRCEHHRSIALLPDAATMDGMAFLSFNRAGIQPGDRLCAAVSGGADSVALLLAFHAERASLGVGLSAVHVHHGLRGAEADGDVVFVQELCAYLDVPLHMHHASISGRVHETGESVEEAARKVRYQFFRELLAEGTTDAVLTAHTLDDQAETVMMKLLRGAWTEGLSAIHPTVAEKRGKILRPLLAVRRAEIEAYLDDLKQPWREDATNAETIYTRNRIRHRLMPLLREFNPGIDQALVNVAALARDDEAYWQRTIAQLLERLLLAGKPVRGGGRAVGTLPGQTEVAMELDRLRQLDSATRRRILRAAARQMGVRLHFDDTARLMAMCEAGNTRLNLQLAGGLRAQRSIRELRLSRQPA